MYIYHSRVEVRVRDLFTQNVKSRRDELEKVMKTGTNSWVVVSSDKNFITLVMCLIGILRYHIILNVIKRSERFTLYNF